MKRILYVLIALVPLVSCGPKTEIQAPDRSAVIAPESQKPDETIRPVVAGEVKTKDVGTLKAAVAARFSSVDKVGLRCGLQRSRSEFNHMPFPIQHNTEEYGTIKENIFHEAKKNPLSTFSIDVDVASYANARRFLNSGQLPPRDAVRIEEFINYFPYKYEGPKNSHPVAIHTDVADCPWSDQHRLVRIGLKGRDIKTEGLPSTNLVFLIDVSGSMQQPNKLPLVKSALRLLVNQLRAKDKVAIVVYAGSAGLVLPSTSGDNKEKITEAIDRLEAGGSTAGGAGIKLAYDVAKKNFLKNGNNRVILASDGDFNVGASSDGEMIQLIENKRKEGIFLTVLGFGTGNYKDSKMEKLADNGNGNYAYIDNLLEAKKVLVNEMGATLHTIAKDVKIQVEFNPARVQAYRLVGYENRLLRNEDFNDDKKDAGDMGAGSTVTALYEIVPVGVKFNAGSVDPLKYQASSATPQASESEELLTVKFRYKDPKGSASKLVSRPVVDRKTDLLETSDDFRFAAAVAGFGMLLRDSEFKNNLTYERVIDLAKNAMGQDPEGYRAEFLKLIKTAQVIDSTKQAMR